ncbi:MAG: Coenzyme F420 hydrogenase/dehydrogenase, beta subunit C-terminal domain [Ignavibacteria bacterium]|jgi:coenzyme F420 hydrogenase subunit beta
MANNISSVVKQGLCAGCGTCEGLCPENAIKMEIDKKKGVYTPRMNVSKCTQCGVCFQGCPGHAVDFEELKQTISTDSKNDILIGNFLDCYTGYAANESIRYSASSGGLVTQLLLFALNNGYIDGALVTRMKKSAPMEPEPFIARTNEEIIEASKSKYCPVPANAAVKAILQSNGRYAAVGLPCHMHGIRKIEQFNQEFKKKIVLHLGIFCGYTPNFWAILTYLSRAKTKPEEVSSLNFRGEGWPGGIMVSRKDGSRLFMAQGDFYRKYFTSFFIPSRCLMCCDQTSELADLSFGDAWLPEYSSDKIGRSIIISRSEIGKQILDHAVDMKAIELAQIPVKLVKRSQMNSLYPKKHIAKGYIALSRSKPVYNVKLPNPGKLDYILSFLSHIDHLYSMHAFSRLILKYLPQKLLSGYRIPYNFMLSRQLKKFGKTF